jgi:hypothetical protein
VWAGKLWKHADLDLAPTPPNLQTSPNPYPKQTIHCILIGKGVVLMLSEMIRNSPNYQKMSTQEKEITLRLATEFEEHSEHTLHLTPIELTETLEIGNKKLWQDFLNMETTKQYIKAQMAFNVQIAQRKTLQSLEREANEGNVNAAKQINELSGILNNIDTNKIIVLHRVNRNEEAN